MNNLSDFINELTTLLKQKKMIQTPELIVAHLCAYLGFLTSRILNPQKALKLIPHIQELVESQAKQSYEKFSTYLENHHDKSKEEKEKQFSQLRNNAPSSIVAQTIRLGRDILDSLDFLYENSPFYKQNAKKTQTELFCPQDLFLNLLKKQANKSRREWKDRLSMLFVINQISFQIGWIIGYYGYCDKNSPTKYLEFGLPCIELYLEFGIKS